MEEGALVWRRAPCCGGGRPGVEKGALVWMRMPTMDFKPSVSVLFGHYSLPGPRILTKLGRTKFEKTT